MKTLKARCRPTKREREHYARPDVNGRMWKSAPPFCANPRGHLSHRVRLVVTHTAGHSHVEYWCGGSSFAADSLTDKSVADRLLCEKCEANAVDAGEATADEICERHVHLGRMVPRRMCCRNDLLNN